MIKKIKNKKSLIAIIAAVFVVLIGATYALLYTNTSFTNLFTLGNYNVITSETFTSPASWQPGVEIPKSITATNNGNIQAVFRVKYTEKWEDSNGDDITSTVPEGTVTINFINRHDWTYNSDDGYYYYNWIINSGVTTSSLISGITLNQDLTGSANCVEDGNTYNCSSSLGGLAGASYILTFTKETVVYSKYQSFWNTNQEITECVPPLYSLPEGRNAYNLQVGDEVCINGDTTECFNFIGYDGNNIKLLSKWNLNVGDEAKDVETNLQDSDVKGGADELPYYGSVAFSNSGYWEDGNGLKAKYGTSYPADVYDPDYEYYSVASYVKNYKNILESYGATINSARLLTYSEAIDNSIGCNSNDELCPTDSFITNTSFWLGTADRVAGESYQLIWNISTSGRFGLSTYQGYYDGYVFGVRPVIVLSKREVNDNVDDANKKQVAEISLPSGRTKDNLEVGDEICIEGTTRECFNFYGYDGDDIKLLSKYNLNVGLNLVSGAQGVQNSGAIAWNRPQLEAQDSNYPALVAFSGSSYWQSGGTVLAKYGGVDDDNDIYDSSYIASPGNSGYSIAYYVEGYKDILESYGAVIKKARLLTYNEATTTADFDCNDYDEHCYTNGFLINTTFWLGSAHDETDIWQIDSEGGFLYYNTPYYDTTFNGVRPVIIISKSSL